MPNPKFGDVDWPLARMNDRMERAGLFHGFPMNFIDDLGGPGYSGVGDFR